MWEIFYKLFFPETTLCKGLFKEHSRQVCVPMVRIMLFNATFNNMSVISWWSMLLVEETGVPGENHQPAASNRQTLSHHVIWSTPRLSGIRIELTTLVVIGTDCIGSGKYNIHTITTTTA